MSFENFVKIINATLLNRPAIEQFNEIQINPKAVKMGDLYIAENREDIDLAIENGAYGIVVQNKTTITDPEIAWIQVRDLQSALIKLLRYRLLNSPLEFYYLELVEFDMAKSIAKNDQILFLEKDMFQNYKRVINAIEKERIVLSDDLGLLNDIYPNFKKLSGEKSNFTILEKKLFTTTLIYNNSYYEELHISSLFLDQLARLLYFFEERDIDFTLENIHPINHLHPIYISKNFKLKGFGESEYVLIVESSQALIDLEYDYIQKNAPWSKVGIIKEEIKTLDDLKKIEIDKFYFILIKANYNQLIKFLKHDSTSSECSLFSEL